MEIKVLDDILYEGKVHTVRKIYIQCGYLDKSFNSTSEIIIAE